jgi:glycosyltransferase involved in cell wall biosynthesis
LEPRNERPVRLPLRAAFLGRFDETKGAHIVVQALRGHPSLPVQLDLFGVAQGDAGERYASRLAALISEDTRIRILPPIASYQVVDRLRTYDLVVVPSQCLETGPLIVLEAFAAQVPVAGSKLGGIAELVTHRVNGLVDAYDSPAAWAQTFWRICSTPDLHSSMVSAIRTPKHIRDAAVEMIAVYQASGRELIRSGEYSENSWGAAQ